MLAGLLAAIGIGVLALGQRQPVPMAVPAVGARLAPCVMDRDGYWRGRISAAATLDVDWRGAALGCEGNARPGGGGLRLFFAGRPGSTDDRLLFVIGIDAALADLAGREHPASVTLVDEASGLFFHSTAGRCVVRVDDVSPLPAAADSWRVDGELYCAGALGSVGGAASVTLGDTAWSGRVRLADE